MVGDFIAKVTQLYTYAGKDRQSFVATDALGIHMPRYRQIEIVVHPLISQVSIGKEGSYQLKRTITLNLDIDIGSGPLLYDCNALCIEDSVTL